MDFTGCQTAAPNPWLWVNGHNEARTNRFYGVGVMPALNPQRANTTTDSIPFPPYVIDVEGYATILAEVVTWPFSSDEAGVSFGGGIVGVRCRTYRRPAADGAGDKEFYVAVPASLPMGYTETYLNGVMSNPAYLLGDFFGDTPHTSINQWAMITADSVIPDTSTPEGLARAQWTPRNLNQECLPFTASFGSWTLLDTWTVPEFYSGWYLSPPISSNHPGFRGGKLIISSTHVNGLSGDITILAKNCHETWDTFDDGETAPSEVGSFTVSVPPYVSGAPVTQEINLPEHLAETDGIPSVFWFVWKWDGTSPGPSDPVGPIVGNWSAQHSPRVDIPLPFFASTGNTCAPGGVIVPPPPP